jgi:hypothetical protein
VSHAANNYVKKLKVGPNGDTLSIQEKAVLWYLADCHSEEAGGIAWPSVKTLSEACHVSERHIRRIMGELEEKQLIGRNAQQRENGSSRSNDYFFVALGYVAPATKPAKTLLKTGGKGKKTGGKAVGKPVKAAPPTLTPTSPSPCPPRQGDPDTHVSTPLTPTSPLETALETALESPVETPVEATTGYDDLQKENLTTAKTARADAKPAPPAPPHPGKWDAFKAELLRKLQQLPEKISVGYVDEFNATIRDTSLIDDSCDGDSMVPTWTISALDPAATRSTLAALATCVKSALWKTAKGNVQVQVYGGTE